MGGLPLLLATMRSGGRWETRRGSVLVLLWALLCACSQSAQQPDLHAPVQSSAPPSAVTTVPLPQDSSSVQAAALQQWWATADPALGKITNALTFLDMDESTGDWSGAGMNCALIQMYDNSAARLPPSGLSTVDNQLQATLRQLGSTAMDCSSEANRINVYGDDPANFQQYSDEIHRLVNSLGEVRQTVEDALAPHLVQ
jgi:hypothetical protein